jgi:hypothetical protein
MTVPGYVLLEEISRGGRRVAYRAIRERDRRRVIVKTFLVPFPDAAEVGALAREHELFSSLDVPGLARSLGVETESDRSALILDDPGGVPLASLWQVAEERGIVPKTVDA